MISAEEFDRLSDLPVDDPTGDMEPYIDHAKTRRPGREIQRVNVDFPVHMLNAIDREATRIGVTRQAFIKLRLADMLDRRVATREEPVDKQTAGPAATNLMDALHKALRQESAAARNESALRRSTR
jgi:hypothetical protein